MAILDAMRILRPRIERKAQVEYRADYLAWLDDDDVVVVRALLDRAQFKTLARSIWEPIKQDLDSKYTQVSDSL